MKRKHIERLLVSIPLLVIIGSLTIIVIKGHINCNDIDFDKLGGWGGFIGGLVGTYLTLIATLYVFKTFHYQRKELKSQKTELKDQKEFTKNQQFETTFFNLINVHRELKNSLKLESNNEIFENGGWGHQHVTYSGIEVISKIVSDFLKLYNHSDVFIFGQANDNTFNDKISKILEEDFHERSIDDYFSDPTNIKPELAIILDDGWNENNNSPEYHLIKINYLFKLLFKNYQNQISHYCRNVYHILKFIKENELRDNKGEASRIKFKQYANLFQSQLTVSEQILLFYNFIHFNDIDEKGEKSTISLVNYYKFLENIGIDNLIFKKHEEFYNFKIKGSDREI